MFLTLGGEGILVFDADGLTHIPACPVHGPLDVVGAGDATMAGITAALCPGATRPEAPLVDNLAASVTLHQIGTAGTASRAQTSECLARLDR